MEKEKIQPKFKAPNYTQVPNEFFDQMIELKTDSEKTILSIIIRETFGWHRDWTQMSITKLMGITTFTRRTVCIATNKLVKNGYLIKQKNGPNGKQESWYKLNVEGHVSNNSYQYTGVYRDQYTGVYRSLAKQPYILKKEDINKRTSISPFCSKEKLDKTQASPSLAKISFNKEKKTFENVSSEDLIKWQKSFPNRNIAEELKKMECWLDSTDKYKTNYKKFIVNWLCSPPKTYEKKNAQKANRQIQQESFVKQIQKDGYFGLKITQYGVVDNLRGFDASFNDPMFEERIMCQWKKIKE